MRRSAGLGWTRRVSAGATSTSHCSWTWTTRGSSFATEDRESDTIRAFREDLEAPRRPRRLDPKGLAWTCHRPTGRGSGTVRLRSTPFDPFLVVKPLNEAVDQVRRSEGKEAPEVSRTRYPMSPEHKLAQTGPAPGPAQPTSPPHPPPNRESLSVEVCLPGLLGAAGHRGSHHSPSALARPKINRSKKSPTRRRLSSTDSGRQ